MKFKQTKDTYIITLERGEKIIGTLKNFSIKNKNDSLIGLNLLNM